MPIAVCAMCGWYRLVQQQRLAKRVSRGDNAVVAVPNSMNMKTQILLLVLLFTLGSVSSSAQFVLTAYSDPVVKGHETWITLTMRNDYGSQVQITAMNGSIIIGRAAGETEATRPTFVGQPDGFDWEPDLAPQMVDFTDTNSDSDSLPYTVLDWQFDYNGGGEAILLGAGEQITLMNLQVSTDDANLGNYPLLWGTWSDEDGTEQGGYLGEDDSWYGGPIALSGYAETATGDWEPVGFDFAVNDGNLAVVPEPVGLAAIGGLGLLGFAVSRRSRK